MSVWPELREEVDLELKCLEQLLTDPALLHALPLENPSNIEIMAYAAILQSFYSGIENLFKRIHLAIDGRLEKSEAWHSHLLNAMAHATTNRPAVITEQTRYSLFEYLKFRHMFRQAYTYELKWSKMSHLAQGMPDTLARVREEVLNFLENIDPKGSHGIP